MANTNHEQKKLVKLINIMDKVADAKQQCTIAERYLFGFIHSLDIGLVSNDMIDGELNIVADLVVNLNLDLEDVKKRLDDYREDLQC